MILPPWSMRLDISSADQRSHHVWLPLFLLWILLLPVAALVVSLAILADVVLSVAGRDYHAYTLLVLHSLGLIPGLRGMVVRVQGDESTVDVTIQ